MINNVDIEDFDPAIFIDDNTGAKLETPQVRTARRKEIRTMGDMTVYRKVPRSQAIRKGAKIVGTRWLDTNKAGPGMIADIRSRLVAREFATEIRDDLFAGTPALEAIKMMISIVASSNGGRRPRKKLMTMDIKRAFLHAPMYREVYIELPEEAKIGDTEDMVGILEKAMYGTRDAPQSWQAHVTNILKKLGFRPGRANACVFHHGARDLQMSVHVDDFLCAGSPEDLRWLRGQLNEHFENTATILGEDTGEEKSTKYLNRILKWTEDGITYEHDPKHIVNILKELGMEDCKGVGTPGVKEAEQNNDDEKLGTREASTMRRVIAIMNYISQDRMDIGYAVKEVARMMANPTQRTSRTVKRLARYLAEHPRCATLYRWQCEPENFTTYSDSDWAGCVWTRRSTTGGVLLRGGPCD